MTSLIAYSLIIREKITPRPGVVCMAPWNKNIFSIRVNGVGELDFWHALRQELLHVLQLHFRECRRAVVLKLSMSSLIEIF